MDEDCPMRFCRTRFGTLELEIMDEPSWQEFERIFWAIHKHFRGCVRAQIDDYITGDVRYWDIEIEGKILTLHLEHYLGICLFAAEPEGEELVRLVSTFLQSYLQQPLEAPVSELN
jgi:hypothetical protein